MKPSAKEIQGTPGASDSSPPRPTKGIGITTPTLGML